MQRMMGGQARTFLQREPVGSPLKPQNLVCGLRIKAKPFVSPGWLRFTHQVIYNTRRIEAVLVTLLRKTFPKV